jgi:16S rRNA (cytosine967-C5)-methyltransferase
MNPLIFKSLIQLLNDFKSSTYPADSFLSYFFKHQKKLGSHDRANIAEIFYGFIRNRRLIEFLAITSEIRSCLLIYLVFIKGLSIKSLSSMIDEDELNWLADKKAKKPHNINLEIKLSLPDWLWEKLISLYGLDKATNIGQSLLEPADLNIRVNQLKQKKVDEVLAILQKDFSEVKDKIYLTHLSKLGISLPRGTPINRHHLFKDGSIEVQDEGSQLISLMLNPKRGQMVADFCAGAGGKTLAIADLMKNSGRVYAFDVSDKRLENLKTRLKRSGASNIYPQRIQNENDLKIKRLKHKFDRVLVDAPCTGFGTLRRNPDLKWRYGEKDLIEINVKQLNILNAAASLCKKGAYLLYATCSILKDENEEIVEKFLENHKGFKILPPQQILKDINFDETSRYLNLLPHQHGTDGFFAALMEKVSDE